MKNECEECKKEFYSKPYDHREAGAGQIGYCINCPNSGIKERDMEFDKSRVYTALNADELNEGDYVIYGDSLLELKQRVEQKFPPEQIFEICGETYTKRFHTANAYSSLAYLVERAENCTNCDCCVCAERNWATDLGNERIYCCPRYTPKAEPKTEKKVRPFHNVDELIKVWNEKWSVKTNGQKWRDCKLNMPLIWVCGKDCSVKRLITSFDETEKGGRVMICGLDCSMEDLFNLYTFLDGSPCGVEE